MPALDDLREYLLTAEVLQSFSFVQHAGLQGRGAHPSSMLLLEGGVAALAKHNEPEHGMLSREVAAWILIDALGWSDMMALTLRRTIELNGRDEEASLAVFWPSNAPDLDPAQFSEEDTWRAGVFDALIAHGDRNGHNWLGVPTPTSGGHPHLKLVDHGYAFDWPGRPLSSTFYQLKQGQQIPQAIQAAVQRLVQDWPPPGLDEYLDGATMDGVTKRAATIIRSGALSV